MTNHLLRDLAPVSDSGWVALDQEAKERLTSHLAARRLVDFGGPHGWSHDATRLGRSDTVESAPDSEPSSGFTARRRTVLPLAEFRVPFTISRTELDDAERGADDLELDDLDRAARYAALVENRTVFHGWKEVSMTGIVESSSHEPASLGNDPEAYPVAVSGAVNTLRQAGICGPYALAIGPSGYTRILETTEKGGYLLYDHLRRVLGGGSVVRTPGLDGAVVLRVGSGDFKLETGQDLAVGYRDHDAESVTCYLEESFSFHVTEPDAAIYLKS